jgi:hypothetical protein
MELTISHLNQEGIEYTIKIFGDNIKINKSNAKITLDDNELKKLIVGLNELKNKNQVNGLDVNQFEKFFKVGNHINVNKYKGLYIKGIENNYDIGENYYWKFDKAIIYQSTQDIEIYQSLYGDTIEFRNAEDFIWELQEHLCTYYSVPLSNGDCLRIYYDDVQYVDSTTLVLTNRDTSYYFSLVKRQ